MAVASAGCVANLRNLVGRRRTEQLSLTVATMPEADDPYAVRIANRLAENMQAAGIDAIVDPMTPDVLYREILINHDFDLYVARYPSAGDPDELYSLLHSAYGEEGGWQNPFGYSDLELDEQLEDQRSADHIERQELFHQILERVVREQPFTTIAFPDRIAGVRTERFDRWPIGGLDDPADYLTLERVDEEAETIELLLRDARITRNRNPIAAEHRDPSDVAGLLYEPLARDLGQEEPTPWLAREVEWDQVDGDLAATVRLRDTPWHDGEPLSASDVAFTYEFLVDTSLGEFESPVPTTWRRGRLSIVEWVDARSHDSVRFRFSVPRHDVAWRALSVPILPQHVWEERSEAADIGPLNIAGQTTVALVDPNEEATGSGPVRFQDATEDEEIVLEAFEDHFLETGDTEGIPPRYADGVPFERARFLVTPSHDAAMTLLEGGEADGTADGLNASVVPRIGRSPDIQLTIGRSNAFYHVGYNCRAAPLTDPRFRQALSRLLDRDVIVDQSFDGYAVPTEVPLRSQWVPDALTWDGVGTHPFAGTNGDLDVETARESFREAGYQYEEGELVRRAN